MIRESDGEAYRVKKILWIRRKEIANKAGEVYLTRWTLLEAFGLALMLHKMHRPDADRCHHDHPWWFTTFVLRGGYHEEITDLVTNTKSSRWNPPGTLLYRPALHTHRVAELPTGSCWTLVLRGAHRRVWGFRNDAGRWKPWDTFVDWAGSVLWCDTRDERDRA